LFRKKVQVTAIHKYIEHNTPKSEENLKELAFLGIDIGNAIPNANIIPQRVSPLEVSAIQSDTSPHFSSSALLGHA
jgi:hypothetical protein